MPRPFVTALIVWYLCTASAFAPTVLHRPVGRLSTLEVLSSSRSSRPLLTLSAKDHEAGADQRSGGRFSWIKRVTRRLDTISSAGLDEEQVLTAGVLSRVKKLHNPITYLILAAIAGIRWDWCFRSPYYWFGVGFCIKWYRARYVFKIPVWDRQPNWNNIITSKEQEKDLKAFTCKNCGSTLFIAKTREFFFEGDTGIGGLGCFSCGAKGKDNFVMDRDRIVEDVADMDDYFEYERPLDFVSAAERRKLLKEAKGDEEAANKLLIERSATEDSGAAAPSEPAAEDIVDAEVVGDDESPAEAPPTEPSSEVTSEAPAEAPPAPTPAPKPAAPPAPAPSDDIDDDDLMDLLGLDD